MKARKFSVAAVLAATLMSVGCSSMSNTGKGALIGTGAGAGAGALVGALIGGGKGAAIGAAVGGGVGATTGAVVGNRMDRQKAELEKQMANAKVEEVQDTNGLKAIKVTFDSGILFATGKADLSTDAQRALTTFAQSLNSHPGTDVAIYGHTDNTGSLAVNQPLSENRAKSVANFLGARGVTMNRMTTYGMADSQPVASNGTVEGRALNRRVEVYITASEQMINEIQASN